jgi:hypothetical protein
VGEGRRISIASFSMIGSMAKRSRARVGAKIMRKMEQAPCRKRRLRVMLRESTRSHPANDRHPERKSGS